jgi:diketogulonate reductase-like aldo/keto reductase
MMLRLTLMISRCPLTQMPSPFTEMICLLTLSVAQLAIAWVLTRGEDIVPVLGSRRREQLNEALGALEVRLDPSELARIAQAVPPGVAAGARYNAHQMAHLDSEREMQQ